MSTNNNNDNDRSQYSWLRNTFWPVYGDENKQVIPMLAMLALVLFNYTSLRIIKDTLILHATGSSEEVLTVLKLFWVVPFAVLFTMYNAFIGSKVSKKNLFYWILLPFLIYFLIFALIYPYVSFLHMDLETINKYKNSVPSMFKYFVPAFGNWFYALFYVMAEMWGTVATGVLFWQFALMTIDKKKMARIFPIFASYSNIGLVVAGSVQYFFKLTNDQSCFMIISSGIFIFLKIA